jgi:hypothetical protein
LPDILAQVALDRIRVLGGGLLRRCWGRHRAGWHRCRLRLQLLALPLRKHSLLLDIFGELGDHSGARWYLGERLRPRLKAVELLQEPAFGIAWRLLVWAGTEAEAVECDRGSKHPRLLDPEMVQLA